MNTESDKDFGNLISTVLLAIPSHRDTPKTVNEIVSSITNDMGLSTETVHGVVIAVIGFLNAFDVIEWEHNKYRIKEQVPHYFRNSLNWYFKNNIKILANWGREGTARDINIENLLDQGSYFLKIMEERRLIVAKEQKIDAEYSRFQPVSIILIKSTNRGKVYLLTQLDDSAQQYQIIGGKLRPNETHFEAAKREMIEEITEHNLVYGRDFELTPLCEKPIINYQVSRTYGALTRYEFWIYTAKLKIDRLRLSHLDLWIPLDDMMKGCAKAGKPTASPSVVRLINSEICNGIADLPDSIKMEQTENLFDYIEVKPTFFGIFSVDVKGILSRLLKRPKGKG